MPTITPYISHIYIYTYILSHVSPVFHSYVVWWFTYMFVITLLFPSSSRRCLLLTKTRCSPFTKPYSIFLSATGGCEYHLVWQKGYHIHEASTNCEKISTETMLEIPLPSAVLNIIITVTAIESISRIIYIYDLYIRWYIYTHICAIWNIISWISLVHGLL